MDLQLLIVQALLGLVAVIDGATFEERKSSDVKRRDLKGHKARSKRDYSDYSNSNGQNSPQYGDYSDYNNAADYEQLEVQCYDCVVHVINGKISGEVGCDDPFNPTGLRKDACFGECYKTVHKTNATIYSITRDCIKNCQEFHTRAADGIGYTETTCCRGHLCNAASNTASLPSLTVITLLLPCALRLWNHLPR